MHFFSAWMSGNQSWFKSFLLHELNFKVVNFPCLHSSMKYTLHVQTIHNVLAGKQVVRRLRRMYGFFPAFFFFYDLPGLLLNLIVIDTYEISPNTLNASFSCEVSISGLKSPTNMWKCSTTEKYGYDVLHGSFVKTLKYLRH